MKLQQEYCSSPLTSPNRYHVWFENMTKLKTYDNCVIMSANPNANNLQYISIIIYGIVQGSK